LPNLTKKSFRANRLSDLLEEYANSYTGEAVAISDLVHLLGPRSIGALLLVFALPIALPVPMPGISFVFGIPLLLLSAQLALNFQHIWLPKFISEKSIPADRFRKIIGYAIPILRRMEKLVRPRFTYLARDWVKIPVGIICILLSLVVALPIPFGNVLPCLAISFFALGLIQQDGLAVTFALTLTISAIVITSTALAAVF
jgi:hypothetical protein